MATKRQKGRAGKKKATGKRKVKIARFDTHAVKDYTSATLRVKIFDRKVKKYIRGEWELSHALAVFGNLLENPNNAAKFGYVD